MPDPCQSFVVTGHDGNVDGCTDDKQGAAPAAVPIMIKTASVVGNLTQLLGA